MTEEKSEFAKVLSTNLEGKEVEAEAMWEERDGRTTFEADPGKSAGFGSGSLNFSEMPRRILSWIVFG